MSSSVEPISTVELNTYAANFHLGIFEHRDIQFKLWPSQTCFKQVAKVPESMRSYEICILYIYIIPLSSNDDISKRRTYPKTIGPTSTCITILKSKIICCYQLFWIWTFLTPAPIMAYEKSASLSSHVGPKESTFGTDLKRMGSRKLWKSTFVTKRMSS